MGDAAGDDDDLEFTVLNKRDVLVYQIPPASSSSGHKADDWKKCIWRGRCRVVGKGKELSIKMLDNSDGKLFAQCTIPNGDHEKYVERVIDSSRYFVLKITNKDRHAFIGMGFEDRNDAFDFNCALSDFKSTFIDKDNEANQPSKFTAPAKDLSLKEGQKITVNLTNLTGGDRVRKREAQANSGGGIGILAPPPPAGQSRRQASSAGYSQQPNSAPAAIPAPAFPVPAATSSAFPTPSTANDADDFFDDFADFQSAGAPPPAAVPVSAPTTVATPLTSDAGLSAAFGGMDLGGQAPPVAVSTAPAPAPAPTPASDPFAAAFGTPAPAAPTAPVAGMDVFASPAPAAAPAKQFDEFDIFK
jgi:hypothetical protein